MTEKYEKMVKIGIPLEAVKHAMAKDNVCKSMMDKFLNMTDCSSYHCMSSIENINSNDIHPKKKENSADVDDLMKKMNADTSRLLFSSSDILRRKMSMSMDDDTSMKTLASTVSTTSTTRSEDFQLPLDRQSKKKSGLVALYWEKISKEVIDDLNCVNVWSIIANKQESAHVTSPHIDEAMLHRMFQRKISKNTATTMKRFSNGNETHQMAKILSNNRAQNISINLRVFKEYSFDDLASIIRDIDPDHQIKGERVLFLRCLLPKQDEATSILQYKGEDRSLSQPELFFRTLLVVPRVSAKVKVIETIELLQQNSDEIISSLHLLTTTCKNVMKSEKLRAILELILKIGNIMNDGSRLGDAAGIRIGSLMKVTQTKSYDRKSTLLDYIVSMISKSHGGRDVLDLYHDIPQCAEASRLQVNDVLSNIKSITTSYKKCHVEYALMRKELKEKGRKTSPGLIRLESFLCSSEVTIVRLHTSKKEALDACRNLIKYCGENGTEVVVSSILSTLKEFMNAVDESVGKFHRLQKKAKDMKLKDPKKSLVNTSSKDKFEGDDASSRDNSSQPTENFFTQRIHLKQHQSSIEKNEVQNTEKTATVSISSSAEEHPDSNPKQILMEMLKKRAKEHESTQNYSDEATSIIRKQSMSPNNINRFDSVILDSSVRSAAPVTVCDDKTDPSAAVSNRSNEKNYDGEKKHPNFLGISDKDHSPKVQYKFSNSKSIELNEDKSKFLKKSTEEILRIHESNNDHGKNQTGQNPKKRSILLNIINMGQNGKEDTKNIDGKGESKLRQHQSNNKVRQKRGPSFPIMLRSSTMWRLK